MGQHVRRQSSRMPALAGRGALTAAAALALLGGGAGVALAGEAPADAGHAQGHEDQGQHHKGGEEKESGGLPIVGDLLGGLGGGGLGGL